MLSKPISGILSNRMLWVVNVEFIGLISGGLWNMICKRKTSNNNNNNNGDKAHIHSQESAQGTKYCIEDIWYDMPIYYDKTM